MARGEDGRFEKPNYPTARFHFNLCDWWIGAFWNKRDRRLFVMFLPVGFVFDFGPREDKHKTFVIGVDDPRSFGR